MRSPVSGPIGTPYRQPGNRWELGYHTGVDLIAQSGTPVVAPADSAIVFAGRSSSSYGTHVIGETVVGKTRYRWIAAHMSRVSVSAGDRVSEGKLIGYSGSTGNATGPHVHFEVRREPFAFGDDVNPSVMLSGSSAGTAPFLTPPRPGRGVPPVADEGGGFLGQVGDFLNPLDEVEDALTKTLPLLVAGALGVVLVVLGLARAATPKAAA